MFNFYLFLICEDEAVAKKVQKLDLPDDKYERIMGVPRAMQDKLMKRAKAMDKQENDEKMKNGDVFTHDPVERIDTNN